MANFIDYQDSIVKVIDPDPTAGTPAKIFNDNFKSLSDGTVKVLGQFPATNFEGAFRHFINNRYNYFHSECDSRTWAGLFPAVGDTRGIIDDPTSLGGFGNCNSDGCVCNLDHTHAKFALCAVNPKYFTQLGINLLRFELHPSALKSFTSLTVLRLNEFTLTNETLDLSDFELLTQITMHIKLSGSSTINISNNPLLQSLWMSGTSYGGMQGLTDANFTLDIATLPSLQYCSLYNVGTGLSTAWIDNMLIALSNSVIAHPRSGFMNVGGNNSYISGASSAAIAYLSNNGWSITYND
jgi:hypothetical protein